MIVDNLFENVAGPEKCWPGYRKVGTKPGTGRNKGKGVNDCEKIKESVGEFQIGDPVIITGNVQFKGKTGDVQEIGRDGAFVVVNLYNYGPKSFHSTDVSYNDYADSDDEQEYQQGVAEGLNEFAPDGFNGGDDGDEFSPEIAKMAQEDGFTKGVSLADGATLERAIKINHWHSQYGGMYKQYFAKGFIAGRKEKIRHDNEQYNLNLKLMKDGSIRRGEQGVAEGRATYGPITDAHKAAAKKAFAAGERDGKAGAEKNKQYMSSALMKTTYLNGYKQGKQGVAEGSKEDFENWKKTVAQKAAQSAIQNAVNVRAQKQAMAKSITQNDINRALAKKGVAEGIEDTRRQVNLKKKIDKGTATPEQKKEYEALKAKNTSKKPGVAEASDISGLMTAASMVQDYIVTAEVDGQTKRFRVRGMTGPRAAQERFLKHASQARVIDVKPAAEKNVAEADAEKIGGRYDPEEFDQMMLRLKTLAGAGPLKTVWDPVKRVYRNVPINSKDQK